MKDGTREHYGLLADLDRPHLAGTADRLLRELRRRHAGSPYFRSAVGFRERRDQASFDPDDPMDPLGSFEAESRAVFARRAWDPEVLRPGVVTGLPATASGGASLR